MLGERLSRLRRLLAGRFEWLVVTGAFVAGGIAAARYLYVALSTIAYPYHLEWMEGGSVETAVRLLSGQSIYPEPSLDYVGYIYAPLYYVVSAGFVAVFGETLFACRLVSFLSVLGTCALLVRFLTREGVPAKWALFAPLLYLSTYEYSLRWFHLARVDSLFVLLFLASLYGMRFWETRRGALSTAVLMTLTFLTKQSALLALFPAGLALLFIDFRRGLIVGLTFTALAGAALGGLVLWTDGWFWYYVFDLPAGHAIMERNIWGFWRGDMMRVGLLVALSIFGLGLVVARRRREGLVYVGALVGAFAASWSSRLHSGGVENVLMPAHLTLCLVPPLTVWLVEKRLAPTEREHVGGSSWTMTGVMAVLITHFVLSMHSLSPMIPDDEQYERGRRMMAYLSEVEGEVLLTDHRWLQTEVGKESFGLGMAAKDVLRAPPGPDPGRDAFLASMNEAFASRRFAEIILSDGHFMRRELSRHYCFHRELEDSPMPVTGWTIRPQYVWVPKEPGMVFRGHECPEQMQPPTR